MRIDNEHYPVLISNLGLDVQHMLLTKFEGDTSEELLLVLTTGNECQPIISIRSIPDLRNVGKLEIPTKFFEVSNFRNGRFLYASSFEGDTIWKMEVRFDDVIGYTSQKCEVIKTYRATACRRFSCEPSYLGVYGTDGVVDIFRQSSNVGVFSMDKTPYGLFKMETFNQGQHMVGLTTTGILLDKYITYWETWNNDDEDVDRGDDDNNDSQERELYPNEPPQTVPRFSVTDEDNGEDENEYGVNAASFNTSKREDEGPDEEDFEAVSSVHKILIENMISVLDQVKVIDDLSSNLQSLYLSELRKEFKILVASNDLMTTKYRNLKDSHSKEMMGLIKDCEDQLMVLSWWVKRFNRLFDDRVDCAKDLDPCTPFLLKGVQESTSNFYGRSTSSYEDATAEGFVSHGTSSVTMSQGNEKYVAPRWLRNAGPNAGLFSAPIHGRKSRFEDDENDRPKMDLNKKISEAVEMFSQYFVNRLYAQLEEGEGELEELLQGESRELVPVGGATPKKPNFKSKLMMKCKSVKMMVQDRRSKPLAAVSIATKDEHKSDKVLIPDASDDGTEEEYISSESISSSSSFELPNDRVCKPGARSNYLLKLLERKEAKRTRTFELKDGMLKFYQQLPTNIKTFIRKFHGTRAIEYLHIFPLCFLPDEMESILLNGTHFLYSSYFIEAMKERFNHWFKGSIKEITGSISEEPSLESPNTKSTSEPDDKEVQRVEKLSMIEPLRPVSPLAIAVKFNCNGDDMPKGLNMVEICPAAWKGSTQLSDLENWVRNQKEEID